MGEALQLRLYVARGAPKSAEAERNLRSALGKLDGDAEVFEVEVLDVFEHTERAVADGVLVTPTLIRVTPDPVLRIAGTFSSREDLLRRLDVWPEGV